MDKAHRVPHIGADLLPQGEELLHELVHAQGGLVVQVLKEHVLDGQGGLQTLPQPVLVEEVAHLNADLGVLVRIEGGDAALGGAEGLAAQALLLIGVLEHVVGHENLGPLGDDQVGGGHSLIGEGVELVHQLADVQSQAVADDVGDMGVKHAGRERMQGEAALIVDDGVAGVGAALIADDHVGGLRQHISDLALALVAPVGAYDRFYHNVLPPETGIRNRLGGFALSGFQHSSFIILPFFVPRNCFSGKKRREKNFLRRFVPPSLSVFFLWMRSGEILRKKCLTWSALQGVA